MKRWAVIIFKANNSLDYFSIYDENKEEAKKSAEEIVADHFYGAKIIRVMSYNKLLGIKK